MTPGSRRFMHWAGSALALVGVVFVVLRLIEHGGAIDPTRFEDFQWAGFVTLTIIYSISNLMLALAWRNLLQHFGTQASLRWALTTYGITQIAKYVPGNFCHIAGRQSMGMAAGLPAWPLLKSTAWELGFISVAGSLFVVLVAPVLWPSVSPFSSSAAFLSICGVSAFCLYRVGIKVVGVFGWYVIFLALSGLLFAALVYLFFGVGTLWTVVCGSYVVAWLIGFVTPGAPAGMGVRELVLVLLLKGVIAEADLILAILLGRMVTIGGDMLFFPFSLAIRRMEPVVCRSR